MSDVQTETEAYQAMLELRRTLPDDPEVAEDLDRAREALHIAWLTFVTA